MTEKEEILTMLRDIREFLYVLAEPRLAERQRESVDTVKQIIGRSEKRLMAAQLMDGSMTRSEILKRTALDAGDFSRMMKALVEARAATEDESKPKLVFQPQLLRVTA